MGHHILKRIISKIKREYYLKTGNYKKLAELLYENVFHRKINWEHPEDLNQWINKIAFESDTSEWPRLADKYEVREYVKEKGFKDNLIPLLAKWEKPDDISFENLPDKCVLKVNNGSGDVRIITDKNKCDIEGIRNYFKKILRNNFGKNTAEPHYLRIKPLIIAESLLDKEKQSFESSSLIDYKFWSFNGKPVSCFVCKDRAKDHFTIDLYTADDEWKKIDDGNLMFDSHHLKSNNYIPKPKQLKKMLEIVSTLSKGIPQVRIDLYEVDGKVYFGEMTLTSLSGRMNYFTNDYLKVLGAECSYAVEKLKIRKK